MTKSFDMSDIGKAIDSMIEEAVEKSVAELVNIWKDEIAQLYEDKGLACPPIDVKNDKSGKSTIESLDGNTIVDIPVGEEITSITIHCNQSGTPVDISSTS